MIPIRTKKKTKKKKTVTKIITHSVHFILAEKKWIWKLESLFEVFKSESAGEKLTQKKKLKSLEACGDCQPGERLSVQRPAGQSGGLQTSQTSQAPIFRFFFLQKGTQSFLVIYHQ